MCRQLDAMDREEVALQAEVPMGAKAWHLQMQETRLKVRGRVGRAMASLQVYRGYRVTMHSRHRGDACFFIHLILPGNTKATMSHPEPTFQTYNSFSRWKHKDPSQAGPASSDSCTSDQSRQDERLGSALKAEWLS